MIPCVCDNCCCFTHCSDPEYWLATPPYDETEVTPETVSHMIFMATTGDKVWIIGFFDCT